MASNVAIPTTPGSPLPPGVRESTVEAGGIRFRTLSGGGGARSPILFLHGWPTWAEVWMPVASVLGLRHPWTAIDLPGQHASSPPPKGQRTMPSFRASIAALADKIEARDLSVIGNSMGGSLALMLALDRPERVGKVAVLDAAGLLPKVPSRAVRFYLPVIVGSYFGAPSPARIRKLLVRAVFHDPAFADDAWVGALISDWSDLERRKALREAALALSRRDASISDELPKITTPTLVISGREDEQFPWAGAEAASRRIPSSRFAVIEGAGHFPMVECPYETAGLLSDFLNESHHPPT